MMMKEGIGMILYGVAGLAALVGCESEAPRYGVVADAGADAEFTEVNDAGMDKRMDISTDTRIGTAGNAEHDFDIGARNVLACFKDWDGDGFPVKEDQVWDEICPEGYIQYDRRAFDCDDEDAHRHPGVVELCDGVDSNCDGAVDEGCYCITGESQVCGSTDVGQCTYGSQTCDVYGRWSECEGNVEPSEEVCDIRDNDCDGGIDEGTKIVACRDRDHDGFGDRFEFIETCEHLIGTPPLGGYVVDCTDCNDHESDINPEAVELCDLRDNNCDGEVNGGFPDWGQPCAVGVGGCQREGVNNCSEDGLEVICSAVEGQPSEEICDGIDNDCDGILDNNEIEYVQLTEHCPPDLVEDKRPLFSPDGSTIAFLRYAERRYEGVFVIDIDGENERKLFDGFGRYVWHQDGSKLYFASESDNTVSSIDTDGNNRRELLQLNTNVKAIFHNNGDLLVAYQQDQNFQIRSINSGMDIFSELLPQVNEIYISPDGSKCVFHIYAGFCPEADCYRYHLWNRHTDEFRQMTDNLPYLLATKDFWFPDNIRFAFTKSVDQDDPGFVPGQPDLIPQVIDTNTGIIQDLIVRNCIGERGEEKPCGGALLGISGDGQKVFLNGFVGGAFLREGILGGAFNLYFPEVDQGMISDLAFLWNPIDFSPDSRSLVSSNNPFHHCYGLFKLTLPYNPEIDYEPYWLSL